MTLDEYLKSPNAMSVATLRSAIGAKSDAQVRQWQHGYANRQPGPIYCVAIERETRGAVRRQDLRSDWVKYWPELAKKRRPATTAEQGVAHG